MIGTSVRGAALKQALGAAVLALASAGAAQAAVITFEGNSGPALNGKTIVEAGYAVNFSAPDNATPPGTVQVGRFINGADPASCGANICPSGNTSIYFDLFGTGYVDITPASGSGTFSFRGLDASFIGKPGTTYPPTPAAIEVFGFVNGAFAGSVQFNLPGPSNGATSFTRYKASPDFAEMQFTEIAIAGFVCDAQGNCTGLDNNPGQFALDNITLSDVPEPATLSLMALGLLGLGGCVRRRS
jgi:hypothetical protein